LTLRTEKGFTLIEVVVVVAIIGIIIPALTMTVIALLTNSQQANNHNIALQQVQNTGYWISHDVQMANNVSFDDPSGFPITLGIPVDTDENNDITVQYLFDGNKLKRWAYDSQGTLVSESLTADYLDVANTTFSTLDSTTYSLTVAVSSGEVTVERSYEVSQRPSSS